LMPVCCATRFVIFALFVLLWTRSCSMQIEYPTCIVTMRNNFWLSIYKLIYHISDQSHCF
jgi:hypothetical protein